MSDDKKVIFQFFGNIGRVQGLDVLVKAIGMMERFEDARFLFIGGGAYVPELKKSIKNITNHRIWIFFKKFSEIIFIDFRF